MRRLTTILLLVPVTLVLLAPPAALATAPTQPASGMAVPGCHPQESHPPSAPSKSEHDCHHCCVSLAAGTVAPALDAAGSLPLQQQLDIAVPSTAPAEPEAPVLFERGPPSFQATPRNF